MTKPTAYNVFYSTNTFNPVKVLYEALKGVFWYQRNQSPTPAVIAAFLSHVEALKGILPFIDVYPSDWLSKQNLNTDDGDEVFATMTASQAVLCQQLDFGLRMVMDFLRLVAKHQEGCDVTQVRACLDAAVVERINQYQMLLRYPGSYDVSFMYPPLGLTEMVRGSVPRALSIEPTSAAYNALLGVGTNYSPKDLRALFKGLDEAKL